MMDYKREMVLVFMPFRNEFNEIIDELKFVKIYNKNEKTILERRAVYEHNLDINKMMEAIKELMANDELNTDLLGRNTEHDSDPYAEIAENIDSNVNFDICAAAIAKLGAVAQPRENIMLKQRYVELVRSCNTKQKEIIFHIIHHCDTKSETTKPLKLYLGGDAGCGKTYFVTLIKETYNRFSHTDGNYDAFIACGSTGKSAVAINGQTLHSVFSIQNGNSKDTSINYKKLHQYRALMKFKQVLIVDEVCMISSDTLSCVNEKLKKILGRQDQFFGGLDVLSTGNLQQLPPVRALPIYKAPTGAYAFIVWSTFKSFFLTEPMHQSDVLFSGLLSKVGDGLELNAEEIELIESRFFTKKDADRLCLQGLRLFFKNNDVITYNNQQLSREKNKHISLSIDVYSNCHEQEKQKYEVDFRKKSVFDTGGLPREIVFVVGFPYVITTNIDTSDQLVNGAVGDLCYVQYDEDNFIKRV